MLILALLFIPLLAQQQQRGSPARPQGGGAAPAKVAGSRGGRDRPAVPQSNEDLSENPVGFTPIFNGKTSGRHVSKTQHHGTNPDYHVLHGISVEPRNPSARANL